MLPPQSATLDDVSRDVGIGVDTLARWRSDSMSKPGRERVWTAAARFDAVLTTAAMDEASKSAWCRAHGTYAQQLATWIGWRLHGWRGGLAAGLLFVIPGAAIILALSVLYAIAANLAWVEALFLGVKAAVLAIVGVYRPAPPPRRQGRRNERAGRATWTSPRGYFF